MQPAPVLDADERARLERNIPAYYAFKILTGLQFLIPIWVLYLTEKRGFSLEQVTILDAPFWLALVVMEVPTGVVADRYGRRLSLLLGTITNTVGIAVFAMSGDYVVILASYLVWGSAFTLYSGANSAFLFDSLKALGREHEYGRILGRSLAMTAVAGIVATLSGPLMAAATDLTVPIYASAFTTAIAMVVVITMMYEPPRFDMPTEHLSYAGEVRVAFRTVWHSPDLRRFIPLIAASLATMMAVSVFSQPFLARHGIETGDVGWFLVFSQAAGVPAALLAHRLSHWLGWRMAFSLFPALAGLVALALWRVDALVVFPFIPLGALLFALYEPMSSDYVNQRIGSAQRATILSFQTLLVSLVVAPLEVAAGALAHRQGLPVGYGFIALFIIAICVPLLVAWLRVANPDRPSSGQLIPVTTEPAAGP